MRKYFALVLLAWMFCMVTLQASAALTAHLDRDRISEGETVQLIIEASGQVSTMPDTKDLNDDFDVVGMVSGSRMNIINGKVDSVTTWTLSLAPKRDGELTIPSFKINGEQTSELTLHVSETSAGSEPDVSIPVFIKTEVDKIDPYVQGMVRYTIRVFFAVNLAQGNLSEPEPEDALVHRLGEDREYKVEQNGRSYHVIERVFVVFPQTSGDVVIPAPVLNAQIPQNTSRRDPIFGRIFTNNRPIRLRGETITLNVRPRPSQSKSQYWLPAESIELSEEWQPDDGEIAVGDPITRNITVKARGVMGKQLPDLQFTDIDGFKLYSDRAKADTQNLQRDVQGDKTFRLAYMPTKAGKYTLPAFTLHWWDTKTDQEQIAALPARIVKVVPVVDQRQDSSMPASDITVNKTDESIVRQSGIMRDTHSLNTVGDAKDGINPSFVSHFDWFWISLFFAVLWLITLGLLWRKRQPSSRDTQNNEVYKIKSENGNQARKRFLLACQASDANQARLHLLVWAEANWPDSPPKGLGDLALRLDDPAVNVALATLDRILYKDKQENWNGQELAKLLSKLPQQSQGLANKTILPGLYE